MNVMKQAYGEYINFTRIWYRQTDRRKIKYIADSIRNKCWYMSSTIVDIKDTHS